MIKNIEVKADKNKPDKRMKLCITFETGLCLYQTINKDCSRIMLAHKLDNLVSMILEHSDSDLNGEITKRNS